MTRDELRDVAVSIREQEVEAGRKLEPLAVVADQTGYYAAYDEVRRDELELTEERLSSLLDAVDRYLAAVEPGSRRMKILIENDYEDGSRSTSVLELAEEPAVAEMDDWWEDVVWPETGDGSGANMDACYTATITEADTAGLVGLKREWVG